MRRRPVRRRLYAILSAVLVSATLLIAVPPATAGAGIPGDCTNALQAQAAGGGPIQVALYDNGALDPGLDHCWHGLMQDMVDYAARLGYQPQDGEWCSGYADQYRAPGAETPVGLLGGCLGTIYLLRARGGLYTMEGRAARSCIIGVYAYRPTLRADGTWTVNRTTMYLLVGARVEGEILYIASVFPGDIDFDRWGYCWGPLGLPQVAMA